METINLDLIYFAFFKTAVTVARLITSVFIVRFLKGQNEKQGFKS